MAAHMAHGGSQARVLIEAVATGLNHSHSNVGSLFFHFDSILALLFYFLFNHNFGHIVSTVKKLNFI